MKILAIEFSSSVRSVAAGDASDARAEPIEVIDPSDLRGDTKPFRLIDSCLKALRWVPSDVEAIVFDLGPGSFTGIRTAISLAQGWQLGTAVRCAGLSAMEIMARQLAEEKIQGPCLLAIPSQRQEYHVAQFEIAGECHSLMIGKPLSLIAQEELESRVRSGSRVYGPGMKERFELATDLFPSARALWRCARDIQEFPKPMTDWSPINLRDHTFLRAPVPKKW